MPTYTSTSSIEMDDNLLEALQQQLEYYFSAQNLAKDSFLQGLLLKSGNHYCPIDVLARFSNVVRIIYGEEEISEPPTEQRNTHVSNLLVKAAQRSEVLVVHYSSEGKVNANETSEDDAQSLLGIGPKVLSDGALNEGPTKRNIIIFREVDENVTEDQIRAIFESSSDDWSGDCPIKVDNIRQEVGNNWFVTVESGSDDDIVAAMFALRTMKLNGDSIKARLKTESVAPKTVYATASIQIPNSRFYSNANTSNHKQRSYRSNNKFKTNNSNSSKTTPKASQSKKAERVIPPPMGESHFPSLGGGGKSSTSETEVPTDANGECESTIVSAATTTKDEDVPKVDDFPKVGGYAAALLKAGPPMSTRPPSPKAITSNTTQKDKIPSKKVSSEQGKRDDNKAGQSTVEKSNNNQSNTGKASVALKDDSSTSVSSNESPIPVPPPTWGSKKSFAAMLKSKQEA